MQVTIFSTTTCPYCKMLKDYLTSKSIVFSEKLVDQDDTARDQMISESGGFLGVPFTVITKDDNSKVTILGFDRDKINAALEL